MEFSFDFMDGMVMVLSYGVRCYQCVFSDICFVWNGNGVCIEKSHKPCIAHMRYPRTCLK